MNEKLDKIKSFFNQMTDDEINLFLNNLEQQWGSEGMSVEAFLKSVESKTTLSVDICEPIVEQKTFYSNSKFNLAA